MKSFRPNKSVVSNVIEATQSLCQVSPEREAPFWLEDVGGPPPDELLACANGLLHVPTGRLLESTPAYFCQSASDVVFDPNATETPYWTGFLDSLFGDDTEVRQLLQEWFGYTLTSNTGQQKILLLYGHPRSGKSTIARVLTKILGRNSVASPTIDALSSNFGLMPLISKPLAVISDARMGTRTNQAAILERLLSISGEDQMTIDRKYRAPWTGRLSTRICIITNELPSLKDGSAALSKRLMTIVLRNSFYGREDVGLDDKLGGELPGILNWAMEGYRRLTQRGHFVQPESSKEAIETIERTSSQVRAFVQDRCLLGPTLSVPLDELYDDYAKWSEAQGFRSPLAKAWFVRELHAAFSGITRRRPRAADGDQRVVFFGIGMIM